MKDFNFFVCKNCGGVPCQDGGGLCTDKSIPYLNNHPDHFLRVRQPGSMGPGLHYCYQVQPVLAWETFSGPICLDNDWWTTFFYTSSWPGTWCYHWPIWDFVDGELDINLTSATNDEIQEWMDDYYGSPQTIVPITRLGVWFWWSAAGQDWKPTNYTDIQPYHYTWGDVNNVTNADIIRIKIPEYTFSGDTDVTLIVRAPGGAGGYNWQFFTITGSGSPPPTYTQIQIIDGIAEMDLTPYLDKEGHDHLEICEVRMEMTNFHPNEEGGIFEIKIDAIEFEALL